MDELWRVTPRMRTPGAKVALAELAARQFGVVTRGQLEKLGATEAVVARWLRDGRLHRVHPGVYAVGHAALALEGRLVAALLYAGPGAMLSHATAAWWWGLHETSPSVSHVSAPHRRRSHGDVKVHDRRRLIRVPHRGLPVTTPAQTLLDLAATASTDDLRRALAEAEYRRLVDLDALAHVCRRGVPGSAALRAAIRRHQPQLARTRSPLERRFLALCEKHGVPVPQMNVRVCGLLVDAFWAEQRVVVELDGHAGHATPARIERDRRRELRLRAAGLTVLRYTWQQLTELDVLVAGDLAAALD